MGCFRFPLVVLLISQLFVANAEPPKQLIWSFAWFEKTDGGWRCSHLDQNHVIGAFAGLAEGDVLISIGKTHVGDTDLVGLVTALRRAQLGIEDTATVLRGGSQLILRSTPPKKVPEYALLVTTADSSQVLVSTLTGIQVGDSLISIGRNKWADLTSPLRAKGISLAELSFDRHTVVIAIRQGKVIQATSRLPLVIHAALFPSRNSNLSAVMLRGLGSPDTSLAQERGRWVLVHFWATWCAPCLKSMPALLELAHDHNLHVVPVGFADSTEKLQSVADKEHLPATFAPNPSLSRAVGLEGVPYDVLLSPDGQPTLIVNGSVPSDEMRRIILVYINTN